MTSAKFGLGICALVFGFTVLSIWRFWGSHSPDLLATWLAGHFYGQGALDQVYPGDTRLFTMLPPDRWWPYLQTQGWDKSVFPFVYPPLWAALASVITPFVSMEGFRLGASLINPALMALMVVLAGRAMGQRDRALFIFTAVGLAIMWLTLPGGVALEQNQPQVLVSFLLVLAIERDRAGAHTTAGAALAFAAAIKLYPALIALLWLASGRNRSTLSFVIAGALLAGLSVALAGWPLHSAFLHQISVIKDSVLLTAFTYGLDPTLAQIFAPDSLEFIAGLDNSPAAQSARGWTVMAKPPLWSIASTAALLALMLFGTIHLRRNDPNAAIWAALLAGIALISPLSWGYHYLPALAFAPAVVAGFGPRWGGFLLAIILAPISTPGLDLMLRLPNPTETAQMAGTGAMILLCTALLATARRPTI